MCVYNVAFELCLWVVIVIFVDVENEFYSSSLTKKTMKLWGKNPIKKVRIAAVNLDDIKKKVVGKLL